MMELRMLVQLEVEEVGTGVYTIQSSTTFSEFTAT